MAAFYKYGSKSFLSIDSIGDCETFYTHSLRWYTPKTAEMRFNDFNVGLGVFSMQGFEHRNKQSKRMFRTRTNAKGNLCMQSIQTLHELFQHDIDW